MIRQDYIESLLEKPYWLIDVLPKQVPAGSAGQYFKVERYFLSLLDEISGKFARILIRLNCYCDLQVSTDGETWILNESPEDLVRRFEESIASHSPLSILVGSDKDGKRGVGSNALFETSHQVFGGFVQDPGLPVRAHLKVTVAVQPDEDPGELPANLIKQGQEIPLHLEVLAGGSGRDLLRQDIDQPVGLLKQGLYVILTDHSSSNISSRNSDASATQSGQSRRGFLVPTPLSSLHWVAPFRCWNFSMICFIRARERLRSLVARPTIIPAPTRAPQVPSMLPMPVP